MPGYTDVMGYLGDENSSLEYLFDLFAGAGGMGSTDNIINQLIPGRFGAEAGTFETEDWLGDAGGIMDAWSQYATGEDLGGTNQLYGAAAGGLGEGMGGEGEATQEFDPTSFFDASEEEMRGFLENYLAGGISGEGTKKVYDPDSESWEEVTQSANIEELLGGEDPQDWIDEFMTNIEGIREGQKMLLTPEEYGLEEKLASAKGKARRGTKKAGAKYMPREIGSRYGELQGRLAGGSGEAAEAGYEADVYGLQREAGTAGRDIRQDFADEYYGSIADWLQSTQ